MGVEGRRGWWGQGCWACRLQAGILWPHGVRLCARPVLGQQRLLRGQPEQRTPLSKGQPPAPWPISERWAGPGASLCCWGFGCFALVAPVECGRGDGPRAPSRASPLQASPRLPLLAATGAPGPSVAGPEAARLGFLPPALLGEEVGPCVCEAGVWGDGCCRPAGCAGKGVPEGPEGPALPSSCEVRAPDSLGSSGGGAQTPSQH